MVVVDENLAAMNLDYISSDGSRGALSDGVSAPQANSRSREPSASANVASAPWPYASRIMKPDKVV
jgi:hypothetical protein